MTEAVLSSADALDMAPAFKALGDPVRLQLMSMIASNAGGEVCVCDLTPAFELSGPTISHHLKTLRQAGPVTAERRGTWVWYRPVTSRLAALSALLGDTLPDGPSGSWSPFVHQMFIAKPLTPAALAVFHYRVVISASSDTKIADVLRLLADPTRAAIVEALAAGPACNCHLVEELGLAQPNVSNHLRALRQAGVVTTEPHGRFTYYRLKPEALTAVSDHLAELSERARLNSDLRREC